MNEFFVKKQTKGMAQTGMASGPKEICVLTCAFVLLCQILPVMPNE